MQIKAMTFNEDAVLYDKMRPGYPPALFSDLKSLAKLSDASKILEVGCGTGQATRELAKISSHITCIDPGLNLLNAAKNNLPELEYKNTTFEDFDTPATFNLIISATAWHWVDPKIGYKKAYSMLEDDGKLAIIHNFHIDSNPDAFHNRAQYIYAKYSNKTSDLASRQPITNTANSLKNKFFNSVSQTEYPWEQTYTVDEYIALRNTYSDHRSMVDAEREKFELELRDFAEQEYNGQITKHYVAVMFLCAKNL